MLKKLINDAMAMQMLGAQFAHACKIGCVVYFVGELGAGKTTLIRGFLRGLGYEGRVKSPTYTLVESYPIDHYQVVHFDLYRLTDPEELEFIGIRDYFSEHHICLIEWPERGEGVLPAADIICKIHYHDDARSVTLEPQSDKGRTILQTLSN